MARKKLWDQKLDSDNVILYAIASYRNNIGTWSEFLNSIKLFSRIDRLITKLKEDLDYSPNRVQYILNQIVFLGNYYPDESLGRILFILCSEYNYPELKAFLSFIYRLPTEVPEVDISSVGLNTIVYDTLESI